MAQFSAGESRDQLNEAAGVARRSGVIQYLASVGIVIVATLLAGLGYKLLGGDQQRDLSNLVMFYLLGVVLVAIWLGRGPAILASFLSVAVFDFLFVPPFYTFAVGDSQYLITFAVMLVVAMVISELTQRMRGQAELARGRERRTAALLALSRQLAASRDVQSVSTIAVTEVSAVFDAAAIVLEPSPQAVDLNIVASSARAFDFSDREQLAAAAAHRSGQSMVMERSNGAYFPLLSSRGALGVLGVMPALAKSLTDQEQIHLLEAFAIQIAAALERVRLTDEARAAWERVEAEFLRNTLLSSVSHDLRTPLAAIAGVADTLLHTGDTLDLPTRRDLTETMLDESRRMERTIGNLLDVTRLESGGLSLKREWQPLNELVGSALARLQGRLGDRPISLNLPADLPMIRVDALSFEQVLVNLLDNAAEYTPAQSRLTLTGEVKNDQVILLIADQGPGIPAGKEEQIFTKFFRSHPGSGRRGIGLGLAICRGIIEAHGGRITAFNPGSGGATFRIALPIESSPAMEKDAER